MSRTPVRSPTNPKKKKSLFRRFNPFRQNSDSSVDESQEARPSMIVVERNPEAFMNGPLAPSPSRSATTPATFHSNHSGSVDYYSQPSHFSPPPQTYHTPSHAPSHPPPWPVPPFGSQYNSGITSAEPASAVPHISQPVPKVASTHYPPTMFTEPGQFDQSSYPSHDYQAYIPSPTSAGVQSPSFVTSPTSTDVHSPTFTFPQSPATQTGRVGRQTTYAYGTVTNSYVNRSVNISGDNSFTVSYGGQQVSPNHASGTSYWDVSSDDYARCPQKRALVWTQNERSDTL